MNTEQRIQAFSELGKQISEQKEELGVNVINPWFTERFVQFALEETSKMLNEDSLRKWIEPYGNFVEPDNKKKHWGHFSREYSYGRFS
jgi:hypothetical protein